jgi:F0F1-type ATP synthase membrane subunit b/b'
MRRLAIVVVVLSGLAFTPRPAPAQEHEAGQKKEEGFAEKHELALKWANFLLLAGLLGYFIGKNAGPFFAARSAGIRQDMDDSLRQREQAEAKAADVERRLADLGEDIAALRGHSEAEGKAETERMAQHTAAEIAKIQAHAEREIASAGKAARMALKRYSAELAMGLAEQKVRARMNPDTEDALVQGFVRDLK